jgi:hypothetical protein
MMGGINWMQANEFSQIHKRRVILGLMYTMKYPVKDKL